MGIFKGQKIVRAGKTKRLGGTPVGRVMLLFLTLLLILAGCKQREYVTVEKTTTDTLYKYKVRVDSVIRFDSVTTILRGDTVIRDRWHTLRLYHTEVDTVYKTRFVVQPQPYEVIKTVEVNKLYWWQKVLMWIGVLFIVFLLFRLVFFVWRHNMY